MRSTDKQVKNKLKGNFVLAVKTDKNQKIELFWNNKKDLNYLELTPGKELNMSLQ